MNTSHIDQLAEWWETAEEGVLEKGDTAIHRSDGETTVYVAVERAPRQHPNARILARAPKPKPAWHDAVAVIASTDNLTRQVWERDGDGWYGTDGYRVDAEALEDVTPLIEAKVTDEMVDRLEHHFVATQHASLPRGLAEKMLTVALGLETE